SSQVGNPVTNPVTNQPTTVSALIVDPAGTPTAGTTAFVRTADGYVFLVKPAGQRIYNNDNPPLGFVIVSINTTTNVAQVDADPPGPDPNPDPNAPPNSATAPFNTRQLYTTFETQFLGSTTPGAVNPPTVVTGSTGVQRVFPGDDGSNGRDGA